MSHDLIKDTREIISAFFVYIFDNLNAKNDVEDFQFGSQTNEKIMTSAEFVKNSHLEFYISNF